MSNIFYNKCFAENGKAVTIPIPVQTWPRLCSYFRHVHSLRTRPRPAPRPVTVTAGGGLYCRIVNIRLKVNLGDQLAPAMIFAPPP